MISIREYTLPGVLGPLGTVSDLILLVMSMCVCVVTGSVSHETFSVLCNKDHAHWSVVLVCNRTGGWVLLAPWPPLSSQVSKCLSALLFSLQSGTHMFHCFLLIHRRESYFCPHIWWMWMNPKFISDLDGWHDFHTLNKISQFTFLNVLQFKMFCLYMCCKQTKYLYITWGKRGNQV